MMTKEFVAVSAGQSFAGGVLTEAGAYEVNAGRIRTAFGKKESVNIRLARGAESMTRYDVAARLRADDMEVYGRG